MKKWIIPVMAVLSMQMASSCSNNAADGDNVDTVNAGQAGFNVEAESFADLQLLRYQVPGFEELTLQQKQLAYYLYEAALCGRDIIYDQKNKYGLTIRKTIEAIYGTYKGDKNSDDWKKFEVYAGRIWFSNGNYHHYSNEKFIPECSIEYFTQLVNNSDESKLPKNAGESNADFVTRIQPAMYDMSFMPKLVDQRANIDNVVNSANNFYEGVTQKEVDAFYAKFDTEGNAPSWGLNSKLMKGPDGQIVEKVWKVGGMYSPAIEKIVFWLEKAIPVAENAQQKKSLELLVQYYKTGDLKTFDDYSIAWANDTASRLDVVNGFIEVYMDAIGKRGSFESIVSIKDLEMSKRIATIAKEAQWFEDNSPIMKEHKKDTVRGISAKAITVIVESGDAAPSTPIGVNLPNADWIRKDHGSKSVSLSNIVHSYNVLKAKGGTLDEFGSSPEVIARLKKHGSLAGDLHTDMHECIGHASGKINKGVKTTDITLKNYASTMEEARADLVALYYILDQKLVDIGVMPDLEVGKAEYDNYIMNGLMTQLTRLKQGEQLEEAHMRNRQLVAAWAYEKGKKDNVIEFFTNNNKTYVRVNDYAKLRVLFGELLKELQRIKSEGDYKGAKDLVEGYGVKVDAKLHAEILERYAKLDVKPYQGFIQPRLVPVMDGDSIKDVKMEYPDSFYKQMMEYADKYSLLPVMN